MALSKEAQERIKKLKGELQSGSLRHASNGGNSSNNSSNSSSNSSNGGTSKDSSVGSTLSPAARNRIAKLRGQLSDGSLRHSSQIVNEDYIDSFISDANSFATKYGSAYDSLDYKTATGDSFSSYYDTLDKTEDDLKQRAYWINDYLRTHRSQYDEQSYKEFSDYLKSFSDTSVAQAFNDKSKYYSQFGTEDEYNAFETYYPKYQGKTPEEIQEAFSTLGVGEERDWLRAYQGSLVNNTLQGSADFKDYAAKGTTLDYKDFGSTERHRMRHTTATSIDKYRAASMALYEHNGHEGAFDHQPQYDEHIAIYRTMKDEEFETLAYCIAKDKEQGTNLAEQYIDSMEETLKARRGYEISGKIKDKPIIADLYAVNVGLDQFASGLEALVTDKDYYAASPIQVAGADIRESFSDDGPQLPDWMGGASLRQGVYDLTSTASNMAPSILAGAAANYILPGSGRHVSSALMGASAAGNAYQSVVNLGYDKGAAKLYAGAIGTSEAILGELLGGISAFGGVSPKLTKALAGVDNGLLRFALKMGGKKGSEAIEEGLQGVLEPILKNVILGADEDIDWSEVAYSSLLGWVSAGFMETVPTAVETRTEQSLKKQYGGNTDAIIQEGLESAIKSDSYKFATEYKKKVDGGKTLTGAEIRNLLAANQEQITPKDMQKIQQAAEKRLTDLGATEDVSKLAELATKYATGHELSKAEKTFLTSSKYGSRVYNELLPQNIMSGDYTTDWAEEIGTKQVNRTAYNKKAIVKQIVEAMTDTQYKSLEDRVANEKKLNVSEGGQAIIRETGEAITLDKKVEVAEFITDKQTGKVTDMVLKVDGKEVKASEIDYADEDQSYLFSAVRYIENLSPADATVIIRDYDPASGLTVGEYLNGIDEGFNYGYRGYSEADLKAGDFAPKLSEAQAKSAYVLGQNAKKSGIESAKTTYKRMRTAADAIAAKNAQADGFVGSYSGTTYNATQAELLSSVSLEGIQNATDLAGNRDITFNDIGINNQQRMQEWVDAGLAYVETDADGNEYYAVNNAMLMDERERRQKATKAAPKSKKLTITYNHGGGVIEDISTAEEKLGDLNDEQRAGIEVAKILHQMGIGTDFEFFTTKIVKDEKGNPVEVFIDDNGQEQPAYAGLYMDADGKIRINLNAYSGTKGLTLNALSHELGHFIKAWSLEKYEAMAEILVKAYYGTDMTMHQRVLREQARLKRIRRKDVSYDEAYDEVVCNALNRMLEDGKVMERIAEIRQVDKSLADKIIEGIRNFIKRFMKIYRENESLYRDTEALMEMKEVFEQLQNMFAEALVDASDNFQAYLIAKEALGENAKLETNAAGELLIGANESGNVLMYSEQTYLDGGREKLEIALRQNGHTAKEIKETLSYVDDALDYIKILAAGYAKQMGYTNLADHLVANIVTNVKTGKQVMSAIVNNGDYPVNIDLSLICKKRVAYMNLMSRLIRDGVFDKVNYDGAAIAEVNEILRENGFETACLGCFVESRRLQFQTWAETIVSEWNAEVEKRNPNADNFGFAKGKMENLTDADINALTRELESVKKNDQGNVNLGQGNSVTRMGRLLDALPSLQKKLTVEDLLTPEGLTALRKHDGSLFSIVKSRYGAASPKIVQDFNPYASEIAMLTFAQVKGITNNAVKGAQAYVAEVKNEYGKPKKAKGESKADFGKRKKDHEQRVQDEAMRRYLYDIGGARIQSFSDFMIENIFDYIQIFADLAAKRLPLHGYTKEIVCMRLFGMTGAKWNGSLIAHVERNVGKEYAGLLPAGTKDGIPVSVDGKDYVIGFDDYARNAATGGKSFIQSIGMKDIIALQLDPRYSPYVGNITIGVSDAQILAMLDNPLFRMVIPYHASGMLPMFAKLVGVDMYNDYTDYQNTTVRQYYDLNGNAVSELKNAKGEAVKADTSYAFNAEIQKTKDAKTAANNYLKWCAQRHPVYDGSKLVGYATFNPKFSSSPYGTDFTRHENYYKLLEDFNTYDSVTEESTVQGAVTMNFPSEENRLTDQQMEAYKNTLRETGIFTEKDIEKYAKKADMTFKEIIAAEVGNRANYAATQEPKWESTVKAVEAKLQKDYSRDMRSSQETDLDSDGNELSKSQQQYFANSVVRDADDRLMVMYHGTANGGAFTVFDGDQLGNEARTSQVGQGFYFTNAREEAESYTANVDIYGRSTKGKNPYLHQVYLNITNPFNVAEDTLNLDDVKAVYGDGTYDYFFDNWIPFYLNKKSVNGEVLTKAAVQAMSREEKVSLYVDYLAQLGTKELLSNMVRAFPYGKQSELLTAMQNRLGYDGIVEEYAPGKYQYVAFSSEQIKFVDNKNPTTDKDLRYSSQETDIESRMRKEAQADINNRFAQIVDSELANPTFQTESILIGYTPNLLRELGVPSLPMTFNRDHIYPSAKTQKEAVAEGHYSDDFHFHGLGAGGVKGIYDALQDPIAIISAKDVDPNEKPLRSTHSVVAIIKVHGNKKDLLLPVKITVETRLGSLRAEVNEVASAYQRDVSNLLKEAIAQEYIGQKSVFYITKEAKTLVDDGVQFPTQLQDGLASNGIIHRIPEKVNMSVSTNTQSSQFTRWFGDWQNAKRNPGKKVSVVVNADGSPMVVYHGTGSYFTVFNRGDIGYHVGTRGQAEDRIEGVRDGHILALYASIKNPLYAAFDFGDWHGKNVAGMLIETEQFEDHPGRATIEKRLEKIAAMEDGKEADDALRSYLKSLGYDGIAYENHFEGTSGDYSFIAFEPTQLKSASVNVGTFDKKNPDIRYSSQETDADYIRYDRRAILKESKVQEYLDDYAAKSSPKYAQAYIAYVRPRTFLKLTTDDMFERYHIADQAGELDVERLSNSRPGIYLRIDHETGQVTGHEGRHRMSAMDNAGIELVPVLLLDTSNKMTKTDIAEITLHGQFDETAMGIVRDLIPLNYENRDRVIKNFATQSNTQRIGERYGLNKTLRFSTQETDNISNRDMLANAFEGISQNSKEYGLIQEYRGHIKELNKLDAKLSDLNAEIRDIRFGTEGARDTDRLAQLEYEAKEVAKEINRHDKRLLSLEASEPLRKVIERERKKEAQKTKEHVKEIQQNKKVRAEQAELRHKIRKTIHDLDKVLNRGNKKLNVKQDVQSVVAKALQAADILFTENYGSYDMLRNGIGADLSDSEEALVNTCTRMLRDLDKMPTDGYDNWQAHQEAESKLKAKMSKLKDVFIRERKRLNNTTVSSILGELADAYASLQDSEQSYVQGAYSEPVHNFLKSLQSEVGGAIVQDMTKDQLESVYAAYKMVLTTVRKANQMFNEELKQSREQLGNAVIEEVFKAGGVHGLWTKGEISRNQASWNNMKPVWVANRIGSDTFGKLMKGLFKGQYNFAVDVDEAKQFKLEMDKKYRPRNWDAEKLYHFESSTGRKFSLNLQQIMSLYAFSKREQAYSHLLNGGFVFENNSTVVVDKKLGIKRTYIHKGASSYKLNEATLNGIINSLTAEQRAYVDEMQKYLSEVMGEKGNEVSMQLYGIKMFNEEFYFPLRSSGAYMERAKEAEMKKEQGQINLVNSGFTHSVKPQAKNPIILSNFMDVWAEHCNEMSMYHSMVLPMEDFRKVYNYTTVHDENMESASVFQTIQDAYGDAATSYIDQLYRELNAGATVDPRETQWKARISKFKKAAVMLSASVVVQQFSAIGRAYAVIDPKHFVGAKVKSGTNLSAADEMKKYAPVAIIKEMGGFDTGTKGSAKSYIMAEQYGRGERLKGLWNDEQYLGDFMGYLPAKADEITWCAIWEACKRETRATHPKMDVKSEEFLKLAGEKFSEVIEKTQVYDSVLARSANMRSKGALMSMATAFMAEPTTTVNLLEDAIRSKKAKTIARAFGAVAASIVLNNALASIVYAMRDDDEDETFIEKYLQSFASGMIDDINPMTYYPFLKDVYSLFQGYDVERADMSVIADVRDAMKQVYKFVSEDTSEMDDSELAEHNKNLWGAFGSLLDAGCSMFGVPFKNVRRDVNGMINAYNTIHQDIKGRDTSWNTILDKVGSAVKDTIPIYAWTKDKSKADKLYDAIVSGDQAYLGRIKSTYKTDNAYESAVRKTLKENEPRIQTAAVAMASGNKTEYNRIVKEIVSENHFDSKTVEMAVSSAMADMTAELRENDPRIKAAAIAWNTNDLDEYMRIAKEIIAEKLFSQDNVVQAIRSKADSLLPDDGKTSSSKEDSMFTAEKFAVAISQGDQATARAAKEDIILTAQKNGKTAEEAEKNFKSSAKEYLKKQFIEGTLTESKAINALTSFCGEDLEKADKLVGEWAFESEYGFRYDDRGEAYKSGAISADELQDILVNVGGKTEEEAMWQVKIYDWQAEGFDIDSNQKALVENYETYCEPAGIDKATYYDFYEFYKDSGEEGVKNSKTKECMPYIGSLPLSAYQKDAIARSIWAESTVRKYKTW